MAERNQNEGLPITFYWNGPGMYGRMADGTIQRISLSENIEEAQKLANLAGADANTIARFDTKPQVAGKIFTIIDGEIK